MGATALETLEAVIKGYRELDSEAVLAEFHEDISVIGTKGHERWINRPDVEEALVDELGLVSNVSGELANLDDGLEALVMPTNHEELGVAWISVEGMLNIDATEVQGRWTCIVQRFDEKDWRVVVSHFSVPEYEPAASRSEA